MIGRASLAFVLATAAASTALGQEYSNDFGSGLGRATAYGTAAINSGSLRLTTNTTNQNGALVLNTWAEGAKAFDATFTYSFLNPNQSHSADGLSFNLGVIPDGVLPGAAEIGPGNGLTVQFQLFDFDGNGIIGDAGIKVRYNGAVIASVANAISDFSDNGQARPVHIFLNYDGSLTITYNGNPVVTNLATGFVPQPGQRFGFAARTGGESAEQRIDNVVVRPYYAQGSCSNAAAISGDGIWGYSYDVVGSPTEGGASCSTFGAITTRDVWFCWRAESSGTATISNVNLTDDDSILSVYDGCYPCAGGFGEIACNDDAGIGSNGNASQVTVAVKAGGTYGIRVALWNVNNSASGLEGLSITTRAECRADFNLDGAKNVQDIFDFLTAWFAPCP